MRAQPYCFSSLLQVYYAAGQCLNDLSARKFVGVRRAMLQLWLFLFVACVRTGSVGMLTDHAGHVVSPAAVNAPALSDPEFNAEAREKLFFEAIRTGDLARCKAIIAQHAVWNRPVVEESDPDYGLYPIHLCIRYKRVEVLDWLLMQEVVDTNVKTLPHPMTGETNTPLIMAVQVQPTALCDEITQKLIAAGANIHGTNQHGMTPLHIAVLCGNEIFFIKKLLDQYKASPKQQNSTGVSPKQLALERFYNSPIYPIRKGIVKYLEKTMLIMRELYALGIDKPDKQGNEKIIRKLLKDWAILWRRNGLSQEVVKDLELYFRAAAQDMSNLSLRRLRKHWLLLYRARESQPRRTVQF